MVSWASAAGRCCHFRASAPPAPPTYTSTPVSQLSPGATPAWPLRPLPSLVPLPGHTLAALGRLLPPPSHPQLPIHPAAAWEPTFLPPPPDSLCPQGWAQVLPCTSRPAGCHPTRPLCLKLASPSSPQHCPCSWKTPHMTLPLCFAWASSSTRNSHL